MSSTIEISKICGWCGKEFIARKCSTKYCCKRCSEHAYKAEKRKEHVARCNEKQWKLRKLNSRVIMSI